MSDLVLILTRRTLRPSKSTFAPRRAASTASSYLIPVGLPSCVMRGSLPIGLVQGTVTSLGANFAELFFCQLRCMHLLPEKVPRPAIDHVGCDNRASYRRGHEY